METMNIEDRVLALAETIADSLLVNVRFVGFDSELGLYNLAVKQSDKYLQPEFTKSVFKLIEESGLENIAIICNPALFRNESIVFEWESEGELGHSQNSFSQNIDLIQLHRSERISDLVKDRQDSFGVSMGELVLVENLPLAA